VHCFHWWNSTSKVTFTATGFPSVSCWLELPSAYYFDCPFVKAHSHSINGFRVGHISSSGHNCHHDDCSLILRLFRLRADLWAGGIDRSRRPDTSAHPADGFRAPPPAMLSADLSGAFCANKTPPRASAVRLREPIETVRRGIRIAPKVTR